MGGCEQESVALEGDRKFRALLHLGSRGPGYEVFEYGDEQKPQDLYLEDAGHPTMLDSVVTPEITLACAYFSSSLYKRSKSLYS